MFSISLKKLKLLLQMKINIYTTLEKYCLFALLLINLSCENDIVESNQQYPQLKPVNQDQLAGTWKPILLTAPNILKSK